MHSILYADDLFVDLRKANSATYSAISELIKVRVTNNEQLLRVLKNDFAEKVGKIGVIVTKNDKTFKVLLDMRFETDLEYRADILKNRWTPNWIAKVRHRKRNEIKIDDKVDNLITKMNPKSPITALRAVATQYPINVTLIKKSLKKIKKEGAENAKIDDMLKLSIEKGVRLGMLAHFSLLYSDKLCVMTETTAEVPDMEHRFLEGLVYPCPKLMEILARFGCQHSFEVVNLSEKELTILS